MLSGGVHTGKTTLMRELCRRWLQEKIKINGVLSLAYFKNESRLGYDSLILPEEEEFPLLRVRVNSPGQQVGRYYFLHQGLEKAKKAILNFKESDVSIIDEIGPAELNGQGFWNPLLRLLECDQPVILVVRKELVSSLLDKINIPALVVKLSEQNPELELQKWLRSKQ